MSEEVILLGDPVVYRDDINNGFDAVGVVVQTGSCFKVLWNGEHHPRVQIIGQLRLADLDEVEAGQRIIKDKEHV
ncbi:phosphohistidine phosphatase [Acinetobacter nosocomialis]|uniref:phosphohistidine phosphatase n=1 Tax=Acinetobacter nosocomialis TaxID=106654 RepID=UPI001B84155F|nr:phosphohistidine phosphatase [Acinetobacter nosocomialis]MBR7685898.1 phosphohistidine phosphatase [Acinetobacter nosocomialis]MBR7700271.1 phosphohistidine phosphatase [Acinetobacter nosocomialis]MBR7759119.1 phosphohistidine phosphatase [Acinetobacter nosocomialis]MCE5995666.1 phosphohistidine phosphatase [Acinetobacter nosocomialis]